MSLVSNPESKHKADERVWHDATRTPVLVIRSETKYEHRYLVELKDGTRTWVDENELGNKVR